MDKKLSSPLSTLQWVDRDMVKPNDYNPNKSVKTEFGIVEAIHINQWMDITNCCETRFHDY